MPHRIKILISALLCACAVAACKPGVYYPFGNTNATANKTTATNANQAEPAKPAAPTTIRMVVPG